MQEQSIVLPNGPSYVLEADQRFEDGYIIIDGFVYSYSIDRKDQVSNIYGKREISDFVEDESIPYNIKERARKSV